MLGLHMCEETRLLGEARAPRARSAVGRGALGVRAPPQYDGADDCPA